MQNLMIDKMHLDDLDMISNVLISDFDDFWNYNIFKNELLNENSTYIIAKLEDKIVGFAGIWLSVDEAHITNIVINKNYRNQGIASILLENLIELSKEQDAISITLEVHEDNTAAINLYKKFDFLELGKRKNYYKDKSAIIMTLYFKINGGTNEKRL